MENAATGSHLSVVFVTVGYALVSSMLAIMNKYAVVVFPFPALLTMLQYIVAIVAVAGLGATGLLQHDAITWSKMKAFCPSALVFYFAVFTNMKVLHYANVDTFIMFRSSTPLLVALADSLFMQKAWPSKSTFGSLSLILIGALVYVVTDSQINIRAYSWAFAYLFTITFEMVYIKHIVSTIGLNTWGLVLYNNIYAFLLSPIFMLITGEVHQVFAVDLKEYLYPGAIWPVAISCIFGLGISFFGFACRRAISATAFTVVGVTNKFLTILINVSIWDKHASATGVASLLVCVGGGIWYQQSVSGPAKVKPAPIEGEKTPLRHKLPLNFVGSKDLENGEQVSLLRPENGQVSDNSGTALERRLSVKD